MMIEFLPHDQAEIPQTDVCQDLLQRRIRRWRKILNEEELTSIGSHYHEEVVNDQSFCISAPSVLLDSFHSLEEYGYCSSVVENFLWKSDSKTGAGSDPCFFACRMCTKYPHTVPDPEEVSSPVRLRQSASGRIALRPRSEGWRSSTGSRATQSE